VIGMERFKEPEALIEMAKDRDQDILKDRKLRKDVHDLEGTADSHFGSFIYGEGGDLPVLEENSSRIGNDLSCEEID